MNTVYLDPFYSAPSNKIWGNFARSFFNTGNMVFGNGLKKEIHYDEVCQFGWDTNWMEMARNSVFVLPVSNNLVAQETDFARLLYRLASYHLNVVPVGLGIQADLNITPKDYVHRLPGRKIRLMQELSEHSVSLGVRGEYTAECLKILGIKNVRVIGCPSFYSNLISEKDCEQRVECIHAKDKFKLCLNIDMSQRESILHVNTKEINVRNVIQTLPEYARLIRNEDESDFNIFFSIGEWNEWILNQKFSFAFGDRFHGNMMCYLCGGVPTCIIVKDRRIAELVEILRLPHAKSQEQVIDARGTIKEEFFTYSDSFYKNRKKMRDEYISFLEENEIKHNFETEGKTNE